MICINLVIKPLPLASELRSPKPAVQCFKFQTARFSHTVQHDRQSSMKPSEVIWTVSTRHSATSGSRRLAIMQVRVVESVPLAITHSPAEPQLKASKRHARPAWARAQENCSRSLPERSHELVCPRARTVFAACSKGCKSCSQARMDATAINDRVGVDRDGQLCAASEALVPLDRQ